MNRSLPRPGSVRAALVLAVVLAAAPFLWSARPASAARTFDVSLTTDRADSSPADNRCDVSADPGSQCTLRAAIQQANASPGADTIGFVIPGGGVKTIRPNSPLPPITERVTINGYTQPGSRPNTAVGRTNAVLRIELDGSNTAGADGLRFAAGADGALVLGLAIGNFDQGGIEVAAEDGSVHGCFLGTDASGTRDRGNGDGIFVLGRGISVGNATREGRNLISGNGISGVALEAGATDGRVLGNSIGVTRNNGAALGNLFGVAIGAANATVGGEAPGEANVIRFNRGDGISLTLPGTGNRIERNVIAGNADLGIDIGNDGVTPNDLNDPDGGPNRRQNFPVIVSATNNDVVITLNSIPQETFTIRLYSNPGAGDEGEFFHGLLDVLTDATGNAGPISIVPNPPIPEGRSVTVTATRQNGDTSEFSAAVPVG